MFCSHHFLRTQDCHPGRPWHPLERRKHHESHLCHHRQSWAAILHLLAAWRCSNYLINYPIKGLLIDYLMAYSRLFRTTLPGAGWALSQKRVMSRPASWSSSMRFLQIPGLTRVRQAWERLSPSMSTYSEVWTSLDRFRTGLNTIHSIPGVHIGRLGTSAATRASSELMTALILRLLGLFLSCHLYNSLSPFWKAHRKVEWKYVWVNRKWLTTLPVMQTKDCRWICGEIWTLSFLRNVLYNTLIDSSCSLMLYQYLLQRTHYWRFNLK